MFFTTNLDTHTVNMIQQEVQKTLQYIQLQNFQMSLRRLLKKIATSTGIRYGCTEDDLRHAFDLYGDILAVQVFQKILKAYATKLFVKLPKGGTGIVAAATGMDGQIKSGELADNVLKIIDP